MTQIKEFCGLTYNKDIVKDISKVVCPPYDVISEEERRSYANKDSANLIHILLSQEEEGLDKYKVASKKFQELTSSDILTQDKDPAIYFYDHQYKVNSEIKTRLGFIALLKIDDESNVFPHENTHLPAKLDRMQLLNHVKANLSPIFVMFSDREKMLRHIFQDELKNTKPDIDIVDVDNCRHKIWKVRDKKTIDLIKNNLKDKPVFIADGHHRYEVAKQFSKNMKNLSKNFSDDESFNFVMSYFTDVQSSDLTILPIHRLVKEKLESEDLKKSLTEFFEISELKSKDELESLINKNTTNHVFGLYNGNFYFLKLKDDNLIDKYIDLDKPRAYKNLDVTILKYLILKPLFGDPDTEVKYTTKINEACDLVDNKDFGFAIFVNPINIEDLLSVAEAHEKMPQKSTYFYPKVLSGLVIHKFD